MTASSTFASDRNYSAKCDCTIGGTSAGSGESRAEALENAVEKCVSRTRTAKTYEGNLDCDGTQYFIDVLSFHKQFNCQREGTVNIIGRAENCGY